MRGGLAVAQGAISSASAIQPVQPDEFNLDVSTKSALTITSAVTTPTSDSGHVMFDTGAVNGRYFASALDGEMVFGLASAAVGANYLNAGIGRIRYAYERYRFTQGAGTTKTFAVGAIGWTVANPNANADSGLHFSVNATSVSVIRIDKGVTGATIGGPWTIADVGDAWQTIEWAVLGNDVGVRLPDGTYVTFNHALVSQYDPHWFCMEPVRNASTNWIPEISRAKAASFDQLDYDPARLLYYNNLLAACGLGPYVPAPQKVRVVSFAAQRATTSPFSLVQMPPHKAGDLLLMCAHKNGTTVQQALTQPSNPWLRTGIPAPTVGQNNNFLYCAYKVALSDNEGCGSFTSPTELSVVVLRRHDGNAWTVYGGPVLGTTTEATAFLSSTGLATIPYPGYTRANPSNDSTYVRFGCHSVGQVVTGSVPSGFEQLTVGEGAAAQGLTSVLASTNPAPGNPAGATQGVLSNSGTNNGTAIGFTFEVY